jgi:hypothetical protein
MQNIYIKCIALEFVNNGYEGTRLGSVSKICQNYFKEFEL